MQGIALSATQRSDLSIAAIEINPIGAGLMCGLIGAIPSDFRIICRKNTLPPTIVYSHVDALHAGIGRERHQQIVHAISIGSKHVGQMIIEAFVDVDAS